VLPEAQARILRWLGPFSDGLREAWDVPRDLSLPGMAEGLGLVRSALHVPLGQLVEDGLVLVRSAHVIDGGRRKRNVHHLTEEGRRTLQGLASPTEATAVPGQWFGPRAPVGPAYGRDADVLHVRSALEEHTAVAVTGLAGVGKSTVARCLAEAWCDEGGTVRWATVDAYAALSDLASTLDGTTAYVDDASAAAWLQQRTPSELIVLDGCEHIHSAHADMIWRACTEHAGGARWLLVGRAPLQTPEPVQKHVINPLENEAAMHILGDVEDAEAVLSRLGGHPLALHLHRPGLALPEKDDDIEGFVTRAVLADLTEAESPAVDELALLPFAVSGDEVRQSELVGALDERALLQWWSTGGLQLHALVRHVRLETMHPEQRDEAVKLAIDHWSASQSPLAPLMTLHHRIMADEGGVAEAAAAVMNSHAAGLGRLSAVLEDALERASEPEQDALRGVAADVAVRRGEVERARRYLDAMDAPDPTAQAALLRLEGRTEEAEDLLVNAVQTSDALRPRIALLTARIEDRLPEQNEDVEDLLSHLDAMKIGSLPVHERRSGVVASGLLKFSVLVLGGRLNEATELLADLASTDALSSKDVTDLRWRHAIANDGLTPKLVSDLEGHLSGREDLRANALRMSLLERMVQDGHAEARTFSRELRLTDGPTLAERRLLARHATCSARLTEDASRRTKLLHAAALHRLAGSVRAAKTLVDEAHTDRRG